MAQRESRSIDIAQTSIFRFLIRVEENVDIIILGMYYYCDDKDAKRKKTIRDKLVKT